MKTSTKFGITTFVAILVAGMMFVVVHHYRTRSIFSSTKELSSAEEAQYVNTTGTTPEQVTRTLFEACEQGDWTEVAKYWPPGLLERHPDFMETFTNTYGGLQIIKTGTPFKSRVILHGGMEYPGVFVPYEIRLKDGTVKKWQLAIRCDNPDKRWYWDGGM
jgi:hypothetical protein